MTSSTMLRALFAFHQAMNERLWTIIMEHLTDAQFVQIDGYSRGSLRNQLCTWQTPSTTGSGVC